MWIVDACTRDGRGGSPTAVVPDDEARTDAERREIVRLAGTSHAAFLGAAGTVRFFTTEGELVNCGHGTVAAQAVLLENTGTDRRQGWQTTGGRTFATTAVRRAEGIEVWFDQGLVALRRPAEGNASGLLAALGVAAGDLATGDDPCVASPGTPRLLVPLKQRDRLRGLAPHRDRLAAECRRLGYLGCFVHVLEPAAGRPEAHARMFAPAIGVDEDVVNANSSGCLAAHLLATGRGGNVAVHQGDALGRPSTVLAAAAPTRDGITTRVGGIAAPRRTVSGGPGCRAGCRPAG